VTIHNSQHVEYAKLFLLEAVENGNVEVLDKIMHANYVPGGQSCSIETFLQRNIKCIDCKRIG